MNEQDENKLKELSLKMKEEEYKNLSEKEIQEIEKKKEMKRLKNIEILNDTLNILKEGSKQMYEVKVFLPDDIDLLRDKGNDVKDGIFHSCTFSCENIDVLDLAQKRYQKLQDDGQKPKILILNLASATEPGGHTRKGASAQEEELCRRTSLLVSLESKKAQKYYDYNKSLKTHMGSNAIILSPYVEVIKDSSYNMLNKPFTVSIMSCAAPMIRLGLEGISQQEYEDMLCKRIEGMFLVAASQNYRSLILGAFGCGVYGNDAAVVSDLFYRVIHNFTYKGKNINQLFDSIDFAVICNPKNDYNYKEFSRNFSQ